MAVLEMGSKAGRHRARPPGKDSPGPGAAALTLITPGPASHDPREWAQAWLRGAMLALAVLAAAAAVVSWDAQYLMVRSVKHSMAIAALEAGIPDVGALIFAALGIAVALDGKHALRARTLNIACVGLSLGMNALASAHGWRDLAIWVMPSALYALASDTLIGVIRAWALARTQPTTHALTQDDEATLLAVIGGLVLWLLRLTLAPLSTVAGFRQWALEECPTAPGRTATPPGHPRPHRRRRRKAARQPGDRSGRDPEPPGKQARMLALAAQRHDLTTLPLKQVSGIANTIGAEVDLSPGTARRVLLGHVRALQNGHPQKETTP
ncbi:MAG: hypothetical protein ACHP9Z_27360 [Streptosporangiales bacterium]